MLFLNGFINISSDPVFCYNLSQNTPNTKIISLDEDDMYIELLPSNNPNVLMGTNILPNIDVYWAELDGDLQRYNELYYMQLSSPEITDFFMSIIGYVFNGGNIIIFCPEFDPEGIDNSTYIKFIVNYLEQGFGLHLGTDPIKNPFRYDESCIPMYLLGLYRLQIIDWKMFLLMYPLDAQIPDDMCYKVFIDTRIYGGVNSIKELQQSLHRNKDINIALRNIP